VAVLQQLLVGVQSLPGMDGNMLKSGVDPAILLHRYKSKIEENKIWKN
jgi:hypothetical protein